MRPATTRKKEIRDSVDKGISAVTRIIEGNTRKDDKVVLADIGNKLGAGQ